MKPSTGVVICVFIIAFLFSLVNQYGVTKNVFGNLPLWFAVFDGGMLLAKGLDMAEES